VDLVFVQAAEFGGRHRRAKDAEHRSRVEAAGHDRRDELRCHPLHDLVSGGDGGQELLAGSPRDLRSHEGGRQDGNAGMG